MNSREERMQERLVLQMGQEEISTSAYNLIIGAVLVYGFLVNAIMVGCFHEKALDLFFMDASVGIFAVIFGYAVCCAIGTLLVHKSDNPIISFIGFNFFAIPIGLLLSICLPMYPSTIIVRAFVLTMIITAVMMIVATIIPSTFTNMGPALVISLLVCVVVDVVAVVFGFDLVFLDYIVTFIFTLFVGYDWAKANRCVKTVDNAVDNAAELYLDIINLFLRILRILARAND